MKTTSGLRVAGLPVLVAGSILLAQTARAPRVAAATMSFHNNTMHAIPDGTSSVFSPIAVSGLSGTITRVVVSFHISHPRVSDLSIGLSGPSGGLTIVERIGGDGDNFGASCVARTTLDDFGETLIMEGSPPFAGTFAPVGSIDGFFAGDSPNATWNLGIVDHGPGEVGILQCWSLTITTTEPADLAATLSDSPDPVAPGGQITYTGTVTNNGPGSVVMGVAVVVPAETFPTSFTASAGGTCEGWDSGFPAAFCLWSTAAPGQIRTLTLVVEVKPGTPGGTMIEGSAFTIFPQGGPLDPNRDNDRVFSSTLVAAPPTITAISPSSGPAAGGTVVTITGTNLSAASEPTIVRFGPNVATGVSCTATSCTATTPAGTGVVDVFVIVGNQGSAESVADNFTYVTGPAISGISPASGPSFGGTVVTITGSGFNSAAGGTAVRFGSATATAVSCGTATSCTATSPAGTGAVDLSVTVDGQTSANTTADNFTYVTPDATAMTVSGTMIGGAPGGVVRALIGATICGEGGVSGSSFSLRVFSAAQLAGCGTPGAPLSFTVNGSPATATPAVVFIAGGNTAGVKLGGGSGPTGSPPPSPQPTANPTPMPTPSPTPVPSGPPPKPIPGASPSPSPSGTPAPTPMPTPAPVLSPMTVQGTVLGGGSSPAGAVLQAYVGSTLCGSATVGAGGAFTVSVASVTQTAGCGINGAVVAYRVNGAPASPPSTFVSGSTITIVIKSAGP